MSKYTIQIPKISLFYMYIIEYSNGIPDLSKRYCFFPVPSLISTGTVIPMEKGYAISIYLHVHISYIQTLLVYGNVYLKASIGYGYFRIRRRLDAKEIA